MNLLIRATMAVALLVPGTAAERVIRFDHHPAGALPADWESAMTYRTTFFSSAFARTM
jgi:hypothetical protein